MILECDFCGSKWNGDTAKRCPCCNVNRPQRTKGSQAESFFLSEVAAKKRITNSYRRAEVSRYERQTGRQVYT